MTLSLGGNPRVVSRACDCSGGERAVVTLYVYRDQEAYAACFASCYPHRGEVWLDVIFGTWHENRYDDHMTFGCQFIPGKGARLVPAASTSPDAPIFGHKLDRDLALAHPRLPEFWAVVDHVLVHDPVVHQHAYGEHDKGEAPHA